MGNPADMRPVVEAGSSGTGCDLVGMRTVTQFVPVRGDRHTGECDRLSDTVARESAPSDETPVEPLQCHPSHVLRRDAIGPSQLRTTLFRNCLACTTEWRSYRCRRVQAR